MLGIPFAMEDSIFNAVFRWQESGEPILARVDSLGAGELRSQGFFWRAELWANGSRFGVSGLNGGRGRG